MMRYSSVSKTAVRLGTGPFPGGSNSGTIVTIRNNLISNGNTAILVQNGAVVNNIYNNLFGNTTDYTGTSGGTGATTFDPQYADEANMDFRVNNSNGTLDAGTGTASAITFSDGSSLRDRSSRQDGILDGNTTNGDDAIVNMGFHY